MTTHKATITSLLSLRALLLSGMAMAALAAFSLVTAGEARFRQQRRRPLRFRFQWP